MAPAAHFAYAVPAAALRSALIGLLLLAGGCVSLSGPRLDPEPEGWTRETLRLSRTTCSTRECRSRIAGPGGGLEVRTRSRVHGLHEIPGWERPVAERAIFTMLAWGVRQAGGYSGHVEVGLGSHVVTGPGAPELELHCSLFWIDEVELEHDRREGDRVTHRERHARGTQCRVLSAADGAEAGWRFDVGVAPSRDSLAAVFDALVAEESPLVGPRPPLLLDRAPPPGDAGEHWAVTRADGTFSLLHGPLTRLEVERDGRRVAVLHVGQSSTLDLAPDVRREDRDMLRLVAALLTVAPETTAF